MPKSDARVNRFSHARPARGGARASGEARDVGVPDPVPLGSGLRSAARGLPLRAARSHATRHAVKLHKDFDYFLYVAFEKSEEMLSL